MRNESILFTARLFQGARCTDIVQKWVTPKEAERITPLYRRDGYVVSTVDTQARS